MNTPPNPITTLLEKALSPRRCYMEEEHTSAFRLFNGFYEGFPQLVADVYGRTLVLFSYSDEPDDSNIILQDAQNYYLEHLPWINCVIWKHRTSQLVDGKRGEVVNGENPDSFIEENGIKYAINLTMNQDASFYLDTRNLRSWLQKNSSGQSVLNTFAYTGTLGIASLAGGCAKLIQMDLNSRFLDLGRRSAMMNHLDLGKMKLVSVDFFVGISQLKRKQELFDLVIIDPPFFSVTRKGTVNLNQQSSSLINKVRPLVKDGGRIIVINNALFVSGEDYMSSLDELGKDGYLSIEELIPVPDDTTGFPQTIVGTSPTDPKPFNHPTKIVVLRIKRKQ